MIEPIRIELPTGFTVGSVNAYLIVEPEVTLVDCGMESAECVAALQAGLAEHGVAVADIKHVFLTHAHVDHMGMIGWLADHSQATFWVNQYCYDFAVDIEQCWEERNIFLGGILLKAGFPAQLAERIVQGFQGMGDIWGNVSPDRVAVFDVDAEIEIGGQIWQSLYLPGHSATQTGFYQAEFGWLFSADSLLHLTPVPVIEFDRQLQKRSRGLPIHLESIAKMDALDIKRVFPGHGKPIDNHRRLIAKQIDRLHARKEQCFDMVKSGADTIPKITEAMYSHASESGWFLGLTMVLGYLDLLSAEKRIVRTVIDGVWHFAAIEG